MIAGGALALMLAMAGGAVAQGSGDGSGDGGGSGDGATTTTSPISSVTSVPDLGGGSGTDTSRSLANTGQDDALLLIGGGAALGLAVGARRFMRSRSTS